MGNCDVLDTTLLTYLNCEYHLGSNTLNIIGQSVYVNSSLCDTLYVLLSDCYMLYGTFTQAN